MLWNLDITIGRNESIAVIGDVGSGKSSLLAAIAADMRKTNGEMIIGFSRAYCPQYSLIQNASVRENIILGVRFDLKRYAIPQEQALRYCVFRRTENWPAIKKLSTLARCKWILMLCRMAT